MAFYNHVIEQFRRRGGTAIHDSRFTKEKLLPSVEGKIGYYVGRFESIDGSGWRVYAVLGYQETEA